MQAARDFQASSLVSPGLALMMQAAPTLLAAFQQPVSTGFNNIVNRVSSAKHYVQNLWHADADELGYAVAVGSYETVKFAAQNAGPIMKGTGLLLGKLGTFATAGKLASAMKLSGASKLAFGGMFGRTVNKSTYVVRPTLEVSRKLKDFGLNVYQRKEFFSGKQVIFEDPTTLYPTAAIFKLQENSLSAGIYDVISDNKGALSGFLTRSKSLAKSLKINQLEMFGADIQNDRLYDLLCRRGFNTGDPILINAFGFNKYVNTIRKIYTLEYENQLLNKFTK